jgi:HAD superfamily hydrolase (TIGR01549 family)
MRRAVLFDYDDTLVGTRACKYLALQAVAQRHYRVELSTARIDEHWGAPYEQLFRSLFAAFEPDIGRAIAHYEALDAEFPLHAYPDAERVLHAFAERSLVGIVTAASRARVEQQLTSFRLIRPLSLLQTAEDTPFHKPDPRVFDPTLAELARRGIERSAVTYVGDSLRDYAAARDAGLAFWGVLGRTTSQEEFERLGVNVVPSLDALLDVV